MSAETGSPAGKLASEALPWVRTPFLSPWVGFLAAGFCFIAGGFRFAANERYYYEAMNVELPWILEVQLDWGAWCGLALVLVGLAFMLLTHWCPAPRTTRAGQESDRLARGLAQVVAVGAILGSIGILLSGEMIFFKIQASLQQ